MKLEKGLSFSVISHKLKKLYYKNKNSWKGNPLSELQIVID